ncbi:MAG: RNase adapter RapZ [Bryobacterales bacterium]
MNQEQALPQLVIVTGMSGSGKGTVMRVFEDLGYYTVDNLPLELVPKFVDLCGQSKQIERACLVIDVREGGALQRLPDVLSEIREEAQAMVIFLEASDEVLQRRFSETRRPHPIAGDAPTRRKDRLRARAPAPINSLPT